MLILTVPLFACYRRCEILPVRNKRVQKFHCGDEAEFASAIMYRDVSGKGREKRRDKIKGSISSRHENVWVWAPLPRGTSRQTEAAPPSRGLISSLTIEHLDERVVGYAPSQSIVLLLSSPWRRRREWRRSVRSCNFITPSSRWWFVEVIPPESMV